LTSHNESWDLKSFVEAVTAELDRARDLLRVKSAVDRPLTYSVQDLKMNLNVFAEYDGDAVRFRTAEPGEQGASMLAFTLGSITDRMVAETTRSLPKADDVPLDEIEPTAIEPRQKQALRKLGVESKRDVERLAKHKVRVGGVDFAKLAEQMHRAMRPRRRPQIGRVLGFRSPHGTSVRVYGQYMDEVRSDSVTVNGRAVEATIRPDMMEVTLPNGPRTGTLCFHTYGGETLRAELVEAVDDT
jgi:hypothetical protein